MFKVLEFITEALAWLVIAASPTIIGGVIGGIIILYNPNSIGFVIGIPIASAGLIIGITWATNVWKKTGTIQFLSRLLSTPELDNNKDEEPKSDK